MVVLHFIVSEDLFSILIASVMCLHFSMQEEYIREHTNDNCHLCTLHSTCRALCNICMHLLTLLNILRPKYLVSVLERQVSRGDTYGKVANHLRSIRLKIG